MEVIISNARVTFNKTKSNRMLRIANHDDCNRTSMGFSMKEHFPALFVVETIQMFGKTKAHFKNRVFKSWAQI